MKKLIAQLRWHGCLFLAIILVPIFAFLTFWALMFFVLKGERQFIDWDNEAEQIRSVEYIRSKHVFSQTPREARNYRYYWARNLDGIPYDFLTYEIDAEDWNPELIHEECTASSKRDRFSFDLMPAVEWWPTHNLGKGAIIYCQNLARSPYEYQFYSTTKGGVTTVWVQGYYTLW